MSFKLRISTVFIAFCAVVLLPFRSIGGGDEAELFFKAGLNSLKSGDYESALNALREALKFDPENPELLYYIGVAEFNLGETDKALSTFRRAHESLSAKPPKLTLVPSDDIKLIPTHRDGWRVQLKSPSQTLSLEGGSSYKVAVKRRGKTRPKRLALIPIAVMLIWIAAR